MYHMRNVKVNKMREIIDKQNTNLTPSRRAPVAPHNNPTNIMPNNAPAGLPSYVSNVPYRYYFHTNKLIFIKD